MHLLFVVPAYAPFVGGAQTLCRALARGFVRDGHRVAVLTSNAQQADDFWLPPPAIRDDLPPGEEMDGVRIVRLPLSYPWPAPVRFGALRRISYLLARLPLPRRPQAALLRHFTRFMPPLPGLQSELPPLLEKADVVLLVDASWDGLFVGAAQAALARGLPLILLPLIHTGSPTILGHFRMAHQVDVYRRADAVVALSPPEKQLLAGWGAPEERIHYVPLGVEPPAAGKKTQVQATKPASNERLPSRYILFLGATTYDKGAFDLAQAGAALAMGGEDVAIVYAGSQQHQLSVFIDTFRPGIRAILRERLHLLGQVDEERKRELLAGCIALALPSRVDSFGLVLLEAWLHGKPVVAADVGGPASLIVPEESGLLVPFGKPEELMLALHRLLHEPGLAARLGAAGRRAVIQQYTWDKCYDAFHQIAVAVCRNRERREYERL